MFIKNISIEYSLMLIMSIGKKSFTQLSNVINKSRDTVRRMLQSDKKNITVSDFTGWDEKHFENIPDNTRCTITFHESDQVIETDTTKRLTVLNKMRHMCSDEILQAAIKAGIYAEAGALTEKYK